MKTKCKECKNYDMMKETCKLEPFEGQYEDECPKYEHVQMGLIGFGLGICVVGLLGMINGVLGVIGVILLILFVIASGTRNVKIVSSILALILVLTMTGPYLIYLLDPSQPIDSSVPVVSPIVPKVSPVVSPTVPVVSPSPTSVASPKPTVDPDEVAREMASISDPVTKGPSKEQKDLAEQGVADITRKVGDQYVAGYVLMTAKDGSDSEIYIWIEYRENGDTIVVNPVDPENTALPESVFDKMYGRVYDIEYLTQSEYDRR